MLQTQLINQFYTIQDGNGPPLVFLHGLMGNAMNWTRIFTALRGKFTCIAYDQRGHGQSLKPEKGYSPEDYAGDLLKIVDHLQLKKFVLIGHSMGGRNALCFAHLHPERLVGLIAEDIGPEENLSQLAYYEQLINPIPVPFTSREEMKTYFREVFVKTVQARDNLQTLAAFFMTNLRENDQGLWDWRFSKKGILDSVSQGRETERWHEVAGLKMPTLWIRGENSLELSRETYQKILRTNKLIQGVEIPGAAHWVHADQPQLFVAAVENFLQDSLNWSLN